MKTLIRPLMAASYLFLVASVQAQLSQAWLTPYNGTADSTDRAYSVAVDKRGNIYVAGGATEDDGSTSLDFVVVK